MTNEEQARLQVLIDNIENNIPGLITNLTFDNWSNILKTQINLVETAITNTEKKVSVLENLHTILKLRIG